MPGLDGVSGKAGVARRRTLPSAIAAHVPPPHDRRRGGKVADGRRQPHRPAHRAIPVSDRPPSPRHRGNPPPERAPCAAPSRPPSRRRSSPKPSLPSARRTIGTASRYSPGAAGLFSSSSRREAPAASERGEVEERQAHCLLEFPNRIGADEHQRNMRLHRLRPGQAAEERGSLRLRGRDGHRGVRETACRPSSRRSPPWCRRCGRAAGTACSARTRMSRGSPDSPTNAAGAGCPRRDISPRIPRAAVPAPRVPTARATGRTPRRRGARCAARVT